MLKKNLSVKQRTKFEDILSYIYIVFSFFALDAWLRVVTRWIGSYSIYKPAPNLFTLLWATILTAVVTIMSSRKAGRIIYATLYYIFLIYAVVQYGAYLILGKFLYVSDFMFAGEGADYALWVTYFITPCFLLQVAALITVGIIGILLFPQKACSSKHSILIRMFIVVLCIMGMFPIPALYEDFSTEANVFANPILEYERFINPNFGLELTGMYQFPVRDIQIRLEKAAKDHTEEIEMIDAFFAEKPDHSANEMTGIFEGKNVIVVMMESLDDWLITPEDTPTLYWIMNSSINFTNMYTPRYSSGYTFNTEFAFNAGVYPYTNGNVAYTLQRNNFNYSIANIFADAGYTVNSYHEGKSDYYNRGQMHVSLGYNKYHSYQDYSPTDVTVWDDRFLVQSDELYSDIVSGVPFFSFVITYSPHLPYTDEDELAQTALALYPQYDLQEDREVAILRAKARLTDDMFAGLLERLKENDLLENTVIIGFADHYAYGLTDTNLLQQLSEDAGNSILENTPAFIYCSDYDHPITVDKVMQTTDLAPTIMNLFGLEVPKEIMGQDVFDDKYTGFAIFTNGTWLTNTTYVKNGSIMWNNGMSADEITEMNTYVQQVYQLNDAILDSDYYRKQ